MQVLSQKKTSQMRTIESVLNWSLKQSVTSWKTIEARQPFCLWTPATFYRTRSCRRTLWISLKVQ